METEFSDKEHLVRAAWPNQVKRNGEISSAAFKPRDKDGTLEGVSTDRTGPRTIEDSVDFMVQRVHRDSRIVSVSVIHCNYFKLYLKYTPRDYNDYHTEIYSKAPNIPLENMQWKSLAKCAELRK